MIACRALAYSVVSTLVLLSGSTTHAQPSCVLIESGDGPRGTAHLRAETVVAGLEVPWAIAFLPNGDWLVNERPGRVRLVRGGKLVAAPVVRIDTTLHGEGGLLGLALHPAFAQNRLFYVYYTHGPLGGRRNRVDRFVLAADGLSARHDRVIFDDIDAAQYHDGGRIKIGPDGHLYVGTGDARSPERSQDVKSANGKILRLTLDGAIPTDNPWKGSPAFVTGVRNVEAFDWLDQKTLVVADHGPSGELNRSGHDEINVAHAGDNLGWPTIYGCETRAGMVTPLLTWTEAVPPGGAVYYTGDVLPSLKNSVLVGALRSRDLHRVVLDGTPPRLAKHEVYFAGDPPAGFGRLREVVQSPDGQLYVTTSNCDGRGTCPPDKDKILRIVEDR
jgi:glucose/arabinose dehydrogenase